jgi:phage/plasmid-like protein (TIGR03299 family)
MAANLATDKNGNAMVASFREPMWHNQGKVFQEEITDGKEMLKMAHLDWDVLETPVYANTGIMTEKATGWDAATDSPIMSNVLDNIKQVQIPDKKAIYRGDTGDVLGIVGQDFKVFSNMQMIELFDNLSRGHKICYQTAGGIGNGSTIWIMATIPDLKLDIGGDDVQPYMMITNGHVGNRTLTVAPVFQRIVCQNTLTLATQEFRNRVRKNKGKKDVNTGYSIRHTSRMEIAVKEVENAYGNLLEDFRLSKETFEAMMNVKVTTDMKNRFFDFIVDPTKDETEKAKEITKSGETRRTNRKEMLEKLYESPTNQTPASKDTVWGLYNAVIENVDHMRETRCASDKNETACRFESSMFGSGKALKDLAFVKAMELIA